MILKIRNYDIEIDRLNVNLYERKTSENRKDYRLTIGHFNNIKNAVEKILKNEVADSKDVSDLEEFIKVYKEVSKEIIEALEETLRKGENK